LKSTALPECARYSPPGRGRQRSVERAAASGSSFPWECWWRRAAFALLLLPQARSEKRIVRCPHMNVTCLCEHSLPEQAAGGNVTEKEACG